MELKSHEYMGIRIVSENDGGWHWHWFEIKCRLCGKMKGLDMPMVAPLDGSAIRAAWQAGEVLPITEEGCEGSKKEEGK